MVCEKVSNFLSFAAVVLLHQRYAALRRERGDGMLVDHLLASVAVNDDRKIVKCLDRPADLEAIGQIDRSRNVFFPQLVQERILDVDGLVH